ncbi:casein kinase I [Chytriomyces hyalinus]|nr:casein kinase I [Chytriomyces hyalinus]
MTGTSTSNLPPFIITSTSSNAVELDQQQPQQQQQQQQPAPTEPQKSPVSVTSDGSRADPSSILTDEASTRPLISTHHQQQETVRSTNNSNRVSGLSQKPNLDTQQQQQQQLRLDSPQIEINTFKSAEVIRMEPRESTRKREEHAAGDGVVRRESVPEPRSSKAADAREKLKSTGQNPQLAAVSAIKNQANPSAQAGGSSSKLSGSKGSLSNNNNMIGTHFKVGKKIGEGSFGVIYEGLNILTNLPIAIKFEPRKSDAPQLRDEYKTYRLLANSLGIPQAHYFGQEGLHNVLCIDLLGPSLEDMFDLCHRKFSVKTACMVAKQMITRVQTIHEKNLIYRDIKPDNFLIGRLSRYEPVPILQSHSPSHPHPSSLVYMVDFGMAKQYRDPKTKTHIPYREKKSLSGTARYMSVNTHLGREQSRRDDLEALGHVFFYFLRGSLPWQGLKAATNKQKYEKIGEKKQSTPIKELCEGHPEEFSIYQNYVRDLKFDAEPDYEYLKGLMNKVLAKNGLVDDGVYDWMLELDHQRSKKERQRATDTRKVVDASTAAVHTSNNEGLAPTSNNMLDRNASTAPLKGKTITDGHGHSFVASVQDSKDALKPGVGNNNAVKDGPDAQEVSGKSPKVSVQKNVLKEGADAPKPDAATAVPPATTDTKTSPPGDTQGKSPRNQPEKKKVSKWKAFWSGLFSCCTTTEE